MATKPVFPIRKNDFNVLQKQNKNTLRGQIIFNDCTANSIPRKKLAVRKRYLVNNQETLTSHVIKLSQKSARFGDDR